MAILKTIFNKHIIMNKNNIMEKYSKQEFEGYTHRFIVKFKVDSDWRNYKNLNIYSNCDSYQKLENFINHKKSNDVVAFDIIHRASKEQDEIAAKYIDDFLNS